MLTEVFVYTPDNELRTDPFLRLKRGTQEQWVSRHVEIANKHTPVYGDCDDYTLTGIQCALMLGVNPSRLGMCAVVDDIVMRKSVAVKPVINHLIGAFYDGQNWLGCFDTWNVDKREKYLLPIGSGRRINSKERHSGQLLAVCSEGFQWRRFPGGWAKISS
jgi:hypothetical protein